MGLPEAVNCELSFGKDPRGAREELSQQTVERTLFIFSIFRKQIIPGPGEYWAVNLPSRAIPAFIENEDSMRQFKPELTPEIKYEPEPVYYRVKSGDVLGTIPQKYGV